jgi:hypothetical protein
MTMSVVKKARVALLERPPTRHRQRARIAVVERALPPRRERIRAANRDRYYQTPNRHFERQFRCECARSECDTKLMLDVERHRRHFDRFIVAIAHTDGDVVVGVADQFVVVEAAGGYFPERPVSPIR